jgi:cobalamin biosynthesis protein CbiG
MTAQRRPWWSAWAASAAARQHAARVARSGVAGASYRTQAVKALASIDLKRDEPGLQELASQLALPLLYFSSEELAGYQQRLSHHSQIALSAPAATAWRKVPPWPWPSS